MEPSAEEIAAATPEKPVARTNGKTRDQASYLPDIHRLLPASADAEQGILCSILISPNHILGLCAEKRITEAHFHIPAHGTIYGVLHAMWLAKMPIDFITTTERLSADGKLDLVGGPAFITHLFTFLPTSANAGHYLEIVEEKFTLREIIRVCTEHAARAYDEQSAVTGILDAAQNALGKIAAARYALKGEKDIKQLATQTVEGILERMHGGTKYIVTGIPKVDAASRLRKTDYLIISGQTKSGKTAITTDIIIRNAITNNERALWFSLEMPDTHCMERILANVGRLSLDRLGDGSIDDAEVRALCSAASRVSESHLTISDSERELAAIVAKTRAHKLKHPELSIVVVDTIQLVTTPERSGVNREQEVAKISSTLRFLAKDLDLLMIGLSQLNEDGKSRESRGIEHDCTAFWKLHQYLGQDHMPERGKEHLRRLDIRFQRNGKSGIRIPLKYIGAQSRFEDDAEESEEAEEPQQPKQRKWRDRG